LRSGTLFRSWSAGGSQSGGHLLRKGYSSSAIRVWLRRHRVTCTIPERADQIRNRAWRGSAGGRPPVFDVKIDERCNVVERCFNRLKQWRGIATCFDKTAESCQAAVTLASLLMWL
jgi:transposase